MTDETHGEEAAWRDLVTRLTTPTADGGTPPWPAREGLPAPAETLPPWPAREDLPGTAEGGETLLPDAGHSGGGVAPGELPAPPGRAPGGGRVTPGRPREQPPLTGPAPGAARPDPAPPGQNQNPAARARPDARPGERPLPARGDPIPGVIPAPPQIRVVRPAIPPPPPRPADDDDDDHYVPPPPPPLPRLDPVSKGAWAALFGGPGYLLIAIMLGWIVPGWAAFCAVGAFIGGFATLVVRLGDRPPSDSGPDNGAVV